MHIHIKSPTRVDLSGGTLDCWPLYHLIDGPCHTINLSINISTEVHLQKRTDSKIFIKIDNFRYEKEFNHLEECLQSPDKELLLLMPHLVYWKPHLLHFGFKMGTSSQSPVGGGLGGSSSLCVSLIKAFSNLCHQPMGPSEIVDLASHMETRTLKTVTGTQDYYPALQPGLHLMTYHFGTQWEILPFDKEFFQSHMILVYTGRPHHSGLNNWQVIKAAVEKDSKTLKLLSRIAQISIHMEKVCREKDWNQLPFLFQEEFHARIQLSSSFTSPEIEKLQKITLQSGAEAIKICGAGGGGCVMVWSSPERRDQVIAECQKHSFQVIEVKPADELH